MLPGLHHTVLCNRNSQCSFVVCHLDSSSGMKFHPVVGSCWWAEVWFAVSFRCHCFKICITHRDPCDWYIYSCTMLYLHLPWILAKWGKIYHTWIVWVTDTALKLDTTSRSDPWFLLLEVKLPRFPLVSVVLSPKKVHPQLFFGRNHSFLLICRVCSVRSDFASIFTVKSQKLQGVMDLPNEQWKNGTRYKGLYISASYNNLTRPHPKR